MITRRELEKILDAHLKGPEERFVCPLCRNEHFYQLTEEEKALGKKGPYHICILCDAKIKLSLNVNGKEKKGASHGTG